MNEIPSHLIFGNTYSDFEKKKGNPTEFLPISKELADELGVQVENCAFFPYSGETMKPTLNGKGIMLADLSDNKLQDGKIYLLSINSRLVVRRVQILLDKIILIADNPKYQNIEVFGEHLNNLKVIGRLRYIMQNFD
ncbi:S24 family peptidase [Moraxella nasicaprae]|uniref:S24 family peptidase n=1 Tax=Moraxella nasicaprae TaxID=2904122 RepID=A0ABY6F689_9GAMM|nr:S24 family peptidase [Moraxella nasicaprae]UXZ05619.1 S24 family peptidase [Moraxella nasicaprae]